MVDCGGTCEECPPCPEAQDYEALMSIYNANDGSNWMNNSGWGENCDICSWHGVECDSSAVWRPGGMDVCTAIGRESAQILAVAVGVHVNGIHRVYLPIAITTGAESELLAIGAPSGLAIGGRMGG